MQASPIDRACVSDADIAMRGLGLYTNASGRYLDRLERREGRWAIAARICLVEIRNEFWAPTGYEEETVFVPARRDKDDVSYQLPLAVDPSRFTV